ncbi:MAG: glycoside hydrolase family 32 protein, partial [bacterium]
LFALLGVLGNYANVGVTFGVDFLFGSIFTMLAAALAGPWAGLVSALAASSYTWIIWHHPYAIGPGEGDEGCFSGGAFVDRDGRAILSYWGLWAERGVCLAFSEDEHYDHWSKSPANPVIQSTELGLTETVDTAGKPLMYGANDPSQIWTKDGRYYMLTGNLPVLSKIGRGDDAPPEQQGDRVYLFVSDNLEKWDYLHPFYESCREWTDRSEDDMCPSFLPLPNGPDGGKPSGKHLLLFISHNKGCQYYVGTYDTQHDKFLPENHGRMSWVDSAFFAPEALVDDKGRQIMWSWIFDDRHEPFWSTSGWSGMYSLPRSLWLGEDGTLRMAPVDELKMLRQKRRTKRNIVVPANGEIELKQFGKELLELEIKLVPGAATQCGVKVCCSADGQEETSLFYDADGGKLVCDATRASIKIGRRTLESGPFTLAAGELLTLRVFVDRSIVEVYANDRQAIARAIYPSLGGRGVKLFARGGEANVASVSVWELMPSNPW